MKKSEGTQFSHLANESQWLPEQARQVISAWEASGESIAAFARAQGLKAARIYWWRSRLETSSEVEIVPMQVRVSSPIVAQNSQVSIFISNVRIEVGSPGGICPTWCATLVEEVARRLS
jgi:hypothetical protein